MTERKESATGAEHGFAASRPRPVAASFVGGLACLWGVLITLVGVAALLDAHGDHAELAGAAIELAFAVAVFAIALGAFRVKRWAWVLFMTWAAVVLVINLLRVFFFDDPHYSVLAIATVTVFLLTPLDVQVAFGIRTASHVRPDTDTRNSVDGI